ncbi:glutathione S-transferase family protein [Eilatimonas milleporae]|uniref:Glutathione S-transferase n=1 Tax=Eilatimonas milleporae TaxID=911205 RepID=A0A3M0C228_9PROT|nr:glutathione S-transferase family protein [Eilatimonas milleporae]RMB02697.1 glutathione S-transferase [Eilatimonas milleporae]
MADLTIVIGNKGYSSWSMRGWLAVAHTGLDFDEVMLPLDTPTFQERIGAFSPTRQVPVLLHGSLQVWDSLAIIDYCARLSPERYWWPEDPDAFATARSVAAEMHSGFKALRTYAPMNLHKSFDDLKVAPEVAADVERIETIWAECRRRFGEGGPFLFGDFSAADMMFAPVVTRFVTYGIKMSKESLRYIAAVQSHPTIDRWYYEASQEKDRLTKYDAGPQDGVIGPAIKALH